jgi:hypothetical protein
VLSARAIPLNRSRGNWLEILTLSKRVQYTRGEKLHNSPEHCQVARQPGFISVALVQEMKTSARCATPWKDSR